MNVTYYYLFYSQGFFYIYIYIMKTRVRSIMKKDRIFFVLLRNNEQ